MKPIYKLLKQTILTDEELSAVIKHLNLAEQSLIPLGERYAIATYCLRMDLLSFVSMARARNWYNPQNGIIENPAPETHIDPFNCYDLNNPRNI